MIDSVRRIPDDFIQALLSRIDIVEVVGAVVPLRKTGSNYTACCPFHNEKTPSFSINQAKQFYHCFGCGVSGDAIQFIIEHNSLSFVEAVEVLAGKAGMSMPVLESDNQFAQHKELYSILNDATTFYEQQLRQPVAKQAVQYLKDRGLSGATAKHFNLGFAPPGWDNLLNALGPTNGPREVGVQAGLFIKREPNKCYDRFRNRIIFPIKDRRGKVIGFGARTIGAIADEPKYINSPETPVFSKSYELYGYFEAKQAIQKSQSVLVVEGYMDVVSLHQAGIHNVVATLGTACTQHHIQSLLKVVPEIIFCFDGDSAGKKAAWRALELCVPLLDDKYRIKFLILRGNEDPDSFVRKYGVNTLELEIKQATSLPDFLFNTLAKRYDLEQIDDRVKFANDIKQYLLKLPEGMLKTLLFDRLARHIDIDPATFRNKKSATQFKHRQYTDIVMTKHKSISPAMRATALLISDRTLLQSIPNLEGLDRLDIAGKLLYTVCKLLHTWPDASDNEIKEKLPIELGKYFDLPTLRGIADMIPKNGQREELQGAIGLLRRREKELAMDELLRKAKQNALTPEEKLLLQQMLQEKS